MPEVDITIQICRKVLEVGALEDGDRIFADGLEELNLSRVCNS